MKTERTAAEQQIAALEKRLAEYEWELAALKAQIALLNQRLVAPPYQTPTVSPQPINPFAEPYRWLPTITCGPGVPK